MRGKTVTPAAALQWVPIVTQHACSQVTIQEQAGSTSTFKVIIGVYPDTNAQNNAITIAAGQPFTFGSLLAAGQYAPGVTVGWIQWQTGSPVFTQVEL